MVILIKSAVHFYERREACRETWLKNCKYPYHFLIGNIDTLHANRGDEVMLPCRDKYQHLSEKASAAFRWALNQYPNEQSFFFCDDDTYCNNLDVLEKLGGDFTCACGNIGRVGFIAYGGGGILLSRKSLGFLLNLPGLINDDVEITRVLMKNHIIPQNSYRFSQGNPFNGISCHALTPEQMRKLHSIIEE